MIRGPSAVTTYDPKSRYACKVDGCTASIQNGDALHRTSPKGELFEGVCTAHYEGTPEPIAVAIEQRNKAVRAVSDGE